MEKDTSLVFIGGFPSGGTDLLKNILNAHPKVYVNGEMPFLYNLFEYGIDKDYTITSKDDFNKLKIKCKEFDIYNNLENLSKIHFSDFKSDNIKLATFFKAAFCDKKMKVWGNKTPQNTENISSLKQYFPSAKFLIIVRDIRDVALSWNKKWGKNMLLTASKWNTRMQSVSNEDSKVLIVRYEDLLENLKATTEQICNFLEIEWSKSLLEHHKKTEKIIDGKINYGKGIVASNFEKWKTELPKKKLKRIEEVAFTGLCFFSYSPSVATHQKNLNIVEKGIGMFQDIYATIFVGNRVKSNNSFFDRIKEVGRQIKIRTR